MLLRYGHSPHNGSHMLFLALADESWRAIAREVFGKSLAPLIEVDHPPAHHATQFHLAELFLSPDRPACSSSQGTTSTSINAFTASLSPPCSSSKRLNWRRLWPKAQVELTNPAFPQFVHSKKPESQTITLLELVERAPRRVFSRDKTSVYLSHDIFARLHDGARTQLFFYFLVRGSEHGEHGVSALEVSVWCFKEDIFSELEVKF